jgi:hypothetical protein
VGVVFQSARQTGMRSRIRYSRRHGRCHNARQRTQPFLPMRRRSPHTATRQLRRHGGTLLPAPKLLVLRVSAGGQPDRSVPLARRPHSSRRVGPKALVNVGFAHRRPRGDRQRMGKPTTSRNASSAGPFGRISGRRQPRSAHDRTCSSAGVRGPSGLPAGSLRRRRQHPPDRHRARRARLAGAGGAGDCKCGWRRARSGRQPSGAATPRSGSLPAWPSWALPMWRPTWSTGS